jgi:DNA repair protein RadC
MAVTARLKAALALIEVRVVDHLIVGECITSLAARGLV